MTYIYKAAHFKKRYDLIAICMKLRNQCNHLKSLCTLNRNWF